MLPAWKYRPLSASQRRRRRAESARARPFSPAKPWDSGGVAYERLSDAAYLEKTLAALSPNDVLARATLIRRLKERDNVPLLEVSSASGVAGSTTLRAAKVMSPEVQTKARLSQSLARGRPQQARAAASSSVVPDAVTQSGSSFLSTTRRADVSATPTDVANALVNSAVRGRRMGASVVGWEGDGGTLERSAIASDASQSMSGPRPTRIYDARRYSAAPPAPPAASDVSMRSTPLSSRSFARTPVTQLLMASPPAAIATPQLTPGKRGMSPPVRVSSRLARTLMLLESPVAPLNHASNASGGGGGVPALSLSFASSSDTVAAPARETPARRHTPAAPVALEPAASAAAPLPVRAERPPPPIAASIAGAVPWQQQPAPEEEQEAEAAWESYVGAGELCAATAALSSPSRLPDILQRYETRIRAILGPGATPQELAPLLRPARLTAETFAPAAGGALHGGGSGGTPGAAPAPPSHELVHGGARGGAGAPASPEHSGGEDDDSGDALSVRSLVGAPLDATALEGPAPPLSHARRFAAPLSSAAPAWPAARQVVQAEPEQPLPGASELHEFESASTLLQRPLPSSLRALAPPPPPAPAPLQQRSLQGQLGGPPSDAATAAVQPPDPLLLAAVAAAVGFDGAVPPPLDGAAGGGAQPPLLPAAAVVRRADGPQALQGPPSAPPARRASAAADGPFTPATPPTRQGSSSRTAPPAAGGLDQEQRSPQQQQQGGGGAAGLPLGLGGAKAASRGSPSTQGSLRWLGLPGARPVQPPPAPPASPIGGQQQATPQRSSPFPARDLSRALTLAGGAGAGAPEAGGGRWGGHRALAGSLPQEEDADALYEPTPVPRPPMTGYPRSLY